MAQSSLCELSSLPPGVVPWSELGSKASIAWPLPLSRRCVSNCGGERTATILDALIDLALTQIPQGGEIFLGPIRRNYPYVESVALEVVAACARPAAQRLDLEIGLRPRSELNVCCLAEIDPVARHRESVGSRRKIAQEHSTRQAFTHGHAVRGDDWRGQAFPRLELAQEPDPRQPRLDRRGLRYRCRQCRPGHVAGQRLE